MTLEKQVSENIQLEELLLNTHIGPSSMGNKQNVCSVSVGRKIFEFCESDVWLARVFVDPERG